MKKIKHVTWFTLDSRANFTKTKIAAITPVTPEMFAGMSDNGELTKSSSFARFGQIFSPYKNSCVRAPGEGLSGDAQVA